MKNYIKDIITGSISLIKGMRVTFKYLTSKSITVQYPSQKLAMKSRFRGLVDLDKDKCIMCYQCVKICPTACLFVSHSESAEKKKILESFRYSMEFCCFCGFCEQVCPTKAVYMNKIYEVSSCDHEQLYIDLLNPDKYDEWANPTVK